MKWERLNDLITSGRYRVNLKNERDNEKCYISVKKLEYKIE